MIIRELRVPTNEVGELLAERPKSRVVIETSCGSFGMTGKRRPSTTGSHALALRSG